MTAWDLTLELTERQEPPRIEVFQTAPRTSSISIGGSALADVVVSGTAAHVHCYLTVDEAGAVIARDAGTQSGLIVNGSAITGEVAFSREDRLALGDAVIRLVAIAPSELTWKLALKVTRHGNRAGEDIRVYHQAQVIVGRGEKWADLAFVDGNVARKHCMFRVAEDGRVWLQDLGSTNGTHMNGHRVDRAVFSLGDRLHLGDYLVELAEAPKRVPR